MEYSTRSRRSSACVLTAAQRFTRLHQVVRVCGAAILLEVDAAEDQPCPFGHRRHLDRVAREPGGVVVLTEVVETARLGQRIGRRVRRGGRKGHEQSRNPDFHEAPIVAPGELGTGEREPGEPESRRPGAKPVRSQPQVSISGPVRLRLASFNGS